MITVRLTDPQYEEARRTLEEARALAKLHYQDASPTLGLAIQRLAKQLQLAALQAVEAE